MHGTEQNGMTHLIAESQNLSGSFTNVHTLCVRVWVYGCVCA